MEETRELVNKMFIAGTVFHLLLIHTKMPSMEVGYFLVLQSALYTVVMWHLKTLHNWFNDIENSKDISPV